MLPGPPQCKPAEFGSIGVQHRLEFTRDHLERIVHIRVFRVEVEAEVKIIALKHHDLRRFIKPDQLRHARGKIRVLRHELQHRPVEVGEEMEALMADTIDKLPGVLECTCNVIFSRIKDIKGLRL